MKLVKVDGFEQIKLKKISHNGYTRKAMEERHDKHKIQLGTKFK